MNKIFPEGTWEGKYSFGLKKKKFEIPFPIVKIIHGEVSDVNGHLAILDRLFFLFLIMNS